MSRERGKILCHVANSALLVLTLAMSRGMANTDVAHAEGMGNPSVGVTTSSSDTYSHTTQEVIYREKVNQIRPIGDWSTYDYMGSPTISRDVFIQVYVDRGSPLAKYAGAMYDESVRMGLDPNYYLTVAINETSLIPNSHMNPCNIRYASSVLPPNIYVPHTGGFANFSEATINGERVTVKQSYILATRACAGNLQIQHDSLVAEGGSGNILERTVYLETPPTDGNNTAAYLTTMMRMMSGYNRLSRSQNPPIVYSRRINIPLPQLPDSSKSPVNVAINKSVTPLPGPLATNIAA